jgi:hypothetical protein
VQAIGALTAPPDLVSTYNPLTLNPATAVLFEHPGKQYNHLRSSDVLALTLDRPAFADSCPVRQTH